MGAIPKELQPSYVRVLKEAVATAREKERRKRLPGPLLVAGFCLPKAITPVLPSYLQGLLQVLPQHLPCPAIATDSLIQERKQFVSPQNLVCRGVNAALSLQGSSAELRELAAEGLGELVSVTSEAALKPFVVQITGAAAHQ